MLRGIGVVSGFEGDMAVGHVEQTVIGDSHLVGIPADIADDLLGRAEGLFAVDNPLPTSALPEESKECFGGLEMDEGVGKREQVVLEGFLEGVAEPLSHLY